MVLVESRHLKSTIMPHKRSNNKTEESAQNGAARRKKEEDLTDLKFTATLFWS